MVQNREQRRLDGGSVVWTVLDALAVPQRNETLRDDLMLFESLADDSIGELRTVHQHHRMIRLGRLRTGELPR